MIRMVWGLLLFAIGSSTANAEIEWHRTCDRDSLTGEEERCRYNGKLGDWELLCTSPTSAAARTFKHCSLESPAGWLENARNRGKMHLSMSCSHGTRRLRFGALGTDFPNEHLDWSDRDHHLRGKKVYSWGNPVRLLGNGSRKPVEVDGSLHWAALQVAVIRFDDRLESDGPSHGQEIYDLLAKSQSVRVQFPILWWLNNGNTAIFRFDLMGSAKAMAATLAACG